MSITRSTNLDQIYVSHFGLTDRVIADILPDDFSKKFDQQHHMAVIEICLNLFTCELYQENLITSKLIKRLMKTKQVKYLISKINLAQQYHADKLFGIIQTPIDEIISDSLTKQKS